MYIKQRDNTDCGPACLASVAAYYGQRVSIARIRQYAGTDKKGTSILGLQNAAQRLGFVAKGVKGQAVHLPFIDLPAIVLIMIKPALPHHYVVLYKVNASHVKLMDPDDGKMHKQKIEKFTQQWTGIFLLLSPNENFKNDKKNSSLIQRIWDLLTRHRSVIIPSLVGALIYTILGLSTAIFVQKITDHVLIDGNKGLLNLMGVIMVVLLLLRMMISAIKNVLILRTGQQIDARLVLDYYQHLLRLPQQFFDTMRVGEIVSRVNDAVKIRVFINDVAIGLVVNLCIVFFAFTLMFSYYWKMALMLLLVIPFYLIVYLISNAIHKRIQRRLMERAAELEAQLVESLTAIGTIKRFGLENHAHEQTKSRFLSLLQSAYTAGLNVLISTVSVEFISQLLLIILLWVGTGYVLSREISPGELFSFYTLTGYFTGPATTLVGANKSIQEALIASDRLFEVMDLAPADDSGSIILKPNLLGDIRFEQVHFNHGSSVNVFENLNLHIPAGKFTAIIGESGSGKSTLIALLQNIYPIQKGNIFIGQYANQYISHDSLCRYVGIVPQHIDLFSGNVIENIAIGEHPPDLQRVIDICSQLDILSFIESLPNGFHTYLGENGSTLSGGQKQRIAIARALYRKPEILILDEATSALDTTAELCVYHAISNLLANRKTVIVITHRLSTIVKADKIIVLEKGNVIEEGRHEEMILANGRYTQLWQKQHLTVSS